MGWTPPLPNGTGLVIILFPNIRPDYEILSLNHYGYSFISNKPRT